MLWPMPRPVPPSPFVSSDGILRLPLTSGDGEVTVSECFRSSHVPIPRYMESANLLFMSAIWIAALYRPEKSLPKR